MSPSQRRQDCGEGHGDQYFAGHDGGEHDRSGGGEAAVEGGEGGGAGDAPAEQHGQPAHQAEQDAE